MAKNLQDWAEAQKRHHLSHVHVHDFTAAVPEWAEMALRASRR